MGYMCLIVVLVALCCGCSASQVSAESKLLTVSAQTCEQIARQNGRDDIAAACHLAESAGPILESALALQTCQTDKDGGR